MSKPIYGRWLKQEEKGICKWCGTELTLCPRRGHVDSKYWVYERFNTGMVIKVCPNGCHEDGSFIFSKKGRRKAESRD